MKKEFTAPTLSVFDINASDSIMASGEGVLSKSGTGSAKGVLVEDTTLNLEYNRWRSDWI